VRDIRLLEQMERGEGNAGCQYRKLFSLLMQLRKVCNHPYLFDEAEDLSSPDLLGSMTGASGKLALLDRLLVGLRNRGHRVVIFSQFTKMLDIINDYMIERGWRYTRLDGSSSRLQRASRIQNFQGSDDYSVFLMTTRAGGLGINLQSADTVVLYDSDWNPQADRQAMARVHRLGQTKPVWVYRLVSAGTVEERILQRAATKILLDSAVLAGGGENGEIERGTRGLFNIIRESVVGIEKRALQDSEIQDLLDRTKPPASERKEVELGEAAEQLQDTFTVLGKQIPRGMSVSGAAIGREWLTTQRQHSPPSKVPQVSSHTSGGQAPALTPVSKGARKTPCLQSCLQCKTKDDLQRCSIKTCNVVLCVQCDAKIGKEHLSNSRRKCPQHECGECHRSLAQAGGLLRCIGCPLALCEDCLPGGLAASRIVVHSERLLALGYPTTSVLFACERCTQSGRVDEKRAQLQEEPRKALDLSAFQSAGDVDKMFAFLG